MMLKSLSSMYVLYLSEMFAIKLIEYCFKYNVLVVGLSFEFLG